MDKDIYNAVEKKILKGKKLQDIYRIPTAKQTVNKIRETLLSEHDLRELGWADAGELVLSEESRATHWHILGSTRQGKSKLLEALIRYDIDHQNGFTLIDPSMNGDTAYNVLRYCVKQNYTNVVLIDLNDYKQCIPTFNPLAWRGPDAADGIVANTMDAIRLLWGQTDWATTARIQDFLPAILKALYFFKGNLYDSIVFKSRIDSKTKNPVLLEIERKRNMVLDALRKDDEARITLEQVFHSHSDYQEFKATPRRLSPFFKFIPKHVFGSTDTHIDFASLIRSKTAILVNLHVPGLGGPELAKMIGTMVINGIVAGIEYLTGRTTWRGRHYLYVDEAGEFATRALIRMMELMGKSGLWVTLAHQFYKQFDDEKILDGIEHLCNTKVLFATGSTDRNRMLKSQYWGELNPESAAANLKQKECIIKIYKQPAVKMTVTEIEDLKPEVDGYRLGVFKDFYIYKANPFYRTESSIREEIKHRFDYASQAPQFVRRTNLASQEGSDTKVSQRGARPDRPAARAGDTVLERGEEDRADSGDRPAAGREDADVPVSWDVHSDDADAGPPPQGGKGNPRKGGKRTGRKG